MSLHFDKTKTFLFNDGKAEVKDEKLEEIVRSMYAEGDLTITKIAKVCHISEEEVLAILQLPKK